VGFLALALLAFGVFGGVLVLVGASQAPLAKSLDLDLAASGFLASLLSLGIGLGVAVMGPLADRVSWRPLFVAAAAVGALGLLAAAVWPVYGMVLAAVLVGGVGCGGYETLLNTVVPQSAPARAAPRLALVHAAATAGAVSGAALLGMLAVERGFPTAFGATGGALAGVALLGLVAPFPERARTPLRPRGRASGSDSLVAALPLAAVSFAYVGFESALTIFAVPYAQGLGLSAARGVAAISSFWLGLLAGRLLFAVAGLRSTPAVLVFQGLVAAALVAGGAGFAVRAIEVWTGVLGLVLSVVFPLLVAFTTERFSARRGTAVGLVVGAGSLGGFAVPWLTGGLGDAVGARWAVASLSLWCALAALAARVAARPGESARGVLSGEAARRREP